MQNKQVSEMNMHKFICPTNVFIEYCHAICNTFGQFINDNNKWLKSVHNARLFANINVETGFS